LSKLQIIDAEKMEKLLYLGIGISITSLNKLVSMVPEKGEQLQR